MKQFTMKTPTTDWSKRLVVAVGEDGLLYSPQMRDVMSERVPAEALPAVEAFAAIGLAARLLRARMERWCEKEGLSETRLGILFMLRHAGTSPRATSPASSITWSATAWSPASRTPTTGDPSSPSSPSAAGRASTR